MEWNYFFISHDLRYDTCILSNVHDIYTTFMKK